MDFPSIKPEKFPEQEKCVILSTICCPVALLRASLNSGKHRLEINVEQIVISDKKKVILITISHSGFLFRSINTQKEKHLSVSVGLCTYSFCLKLKRDAEELKIYNLLTYSSKKI